MSGEKEYGNFHQGFMETKGINVCTFICKSEVPSELWLHIPKKIKNPYLTRITAGDDRLDYDGESAPEVQAIPPSRSIGTLSCQLTKPNMQ